MTHEEIKNFLRNSWVERYTTEEIDIILDIYEYYHNNKGELGNDLYIQTNYGSTGKVLNLEWNNMELGNRKIYNISFNMISNQEHKVHLRWEK